jgi:hypothetical protein
VTFAKACVRILQTPSAMRSLVGFGLGFVAGWAARSTVESSRAAAVSIASAIVDAVERTRRAVAIEGDYLEDFVAEVRSRVEDTRPWRGPAASNGGAQSQASGGAP